MAVFLPRSELAVRMRRRLKRVSAGSVAGPSGTGLPVDGALQDGVAQALGSVSAQRVHRAAPDWPRPDDAPQRRILQALAARQGATFGELRLFACPTVSRTSRDDFLHLKRLGVTGLRGRGRDATWFIVRTPGNNKAE